MSVESRNEKWRGKLREFRQPSSRGGVKVWMISVAGPIITTHWGLLGGKIQTVQEELNPINVGKSNEKSGAQYALERSLETIRKKMREGYREFSDDSPMDEERNLTINFDAPLPDSLCFYKPKNDISAKLNSAIKAGRALYSVKMNGLAYIIVKGSGGTKPRLYSRRMLRQHDLESGTDFSWNDRFPQIIKEADKKMPENSILLGELVVLDDNGAELGLHAIETYVKNLTPTAIVLNAERPVSFYVWDIAFWAGKNLVSDEKVIYRYELIRKTFNKCRSLIPIMYYTPEHFPTVESALSFAKQHKVEGFVVVDSEGIYGEDAFNFKGKPDRPGDFCGKLKPSYEDDFVAYWDPEKGIGERSTKGRYSQGIKCVALYQYNKDGNLVFISNLSSGMTEEMKTNLASPSLFPQVWKVEYKDRRYTKDGDDTNALDFASYIETREDKTPSECVNPNL